MKHCNPQETVLMVTPHEKIRTDVARAGLYNLLLPVPSASARESAPADSRKGNMTVELLIVGSNANNGSQCGLSYSNSNNAFSNSNDNIGARLIFDTIIKYGDASEEDGRTVEPVSMEVQVPTEQRRKALGMRTLKGAQQSPAAQVSNAIVGIYRKPGSRKCRRPVRD